jgi:predicted esterase
VIVGGLLMAAAAGGVPPLVLGAEVPVAIPTVGHVMKVYLPSNYSDDRAWPVLFFYHGMGGGPDTAFLRELTEGRDFVVVGMPYVTGDQQPRTAQEQASSRQAELAAFRSARSWLAAHAAVDEKCVFLAGVSKGGWTVSFLWEQELSRLGGMAILLAGRQSGPEAPTGATQGKPIYIGVGETDPNLVAALRARQHFKQRGAVLSFEVYEDCGHQVPKDVPILRTWLRVHGPLRPGTATTEQMAEAKAGFEGELRAALSETDVPSQYLRLQALAEDPRLSWCDPTVLAPVGARFAELKRLPPAKDEWQAETRFGELLALEDKIRSLAELKTVRDGFESLAKSHPQTRYGGLAAAYFPAVDAAYRKSAEATARSAAASPAAVGQPRAVTPAFPSSNTGRGAYPIPVRRGNKIAFERPAGQQ